MTTQISIPMGHQNLEEFIAVRKEQASNGYISQGVDEEKRVKFIFTLLSFIDPNFAKLVISEPKLRHLINIAFVTKDENPIHTENYECLEFLGDKIVNLLTIQIMPWENPKQGTYVVQNVASKNNQHRLSDALNLFDLLSMRARSFAGEDKKPRIDIHESLFGLLHKIQEEVLSHENPKFGVVWLNPELYHKIVSFPKLLLSVLIRSVDSDGTNVSESMKLRFTKLIKNLGYDASSSNMFVRNTVEHGLRTVVLSFSNHIVDDIHMMGRLKFETFAKRASKTEGFTNFHFIELSSEEETLKFIWERMDLDGIVARSNIYDLKGYVATLDDTDPKHIIIKEAFAKTAAVRVNILMPSGPTQPPVLFNDQQYPSNASLFIRVKKDRRSHALDISISIASLVQRSVTQVNHMLVISAVTKRIKEHID